MTDTKLMPGDPTPEMIDATIGFAVSGPYISADEAVGLWMAFYDAAPEPDAPVEAASRLQSPAVAEDGWQPIETAPKDGTQVLAPCGFGFLDVLTYSDGAWRETSNLLRARHQPIVWKPLPAAPALRTGGSE